MTTPASPSPSPAFPGASAAPERPSPLSWLAVLSVALGIFAIVTTEILPIGLLTSIGADFTVSDGAAGLMMTMPGLLAAVAAPLITVLTGGVDRRAMLAVFVLLLAAANLVTALASSYWPVLLARVMVGVTIGGFWSIGAGLAGRLVPAAWTARATSVVFAAVPLGSVLGVPLGTLVGDVAGWRTAFAALAVLSLGVLALLLAVVPPLPAREPTRAGALAGALGGSGTRFALVLTFLVVSAHFAAYTYITPFLERVTGAGPGLVTVHLLAYGAAGVAGNFLGGAAAARRPRAAFAGAAALIAAATLLLPVLGGGAVGSLTLLVLWGAAYGAVPVCSQTLFSRAVPGSPEVSAVLFTASFQATLSLGALAGGAVVDRSSPPAVMVLAGAVALVAVGTVLLRRARGAARP
ncbi:Purine ribonucleoside efflux pump NepI [Nocardiopsis dassonvillei]|uniref:MFS transporter n=1 Tax=Nocardiopsis dassonvillei TaxID=2014 RepID=UPI003F56D472